MNQFIYKIFYFLIIIVAVSDGIYAGAPFHNTSTAHPIMIRTEGVPATDATETTVEEVKERPWTISVPVWIPGYTGRFTVGDVEVGGEPDGGFWDRIWQDQSWESPFIFNSLNTWEFACVRIHKLRIFTIK